MSQWIFVALGGAAGACLRYGLSEWAAARSGAFPFGALAANAVGCALAGALLPHFLRAEDAGGGDAAWRAFAIVGVCGGLTTFSAFVIDAARLMEAGQIRTAALYAALTMTAGFGLFLTAAAVSRSIFLKA